MFANRLRLPPLLVVLVVSLILTHKVVKANNSYTALNEVELLQKYVELCGQNDPGRIQLMRTLSPAERSYLWRVHLGLYLARNSALSRDQQNLVVETLELITPKLFNPPDPKDPGGRATFERVEQLRQRGLQLFSKDEAAIIFSALGGVQDGEAVRKYSELSELSKGDRKVSFGLMSAEDKSRLWRIHFGLNLARHPEWTEEQRAIVMEAIAMLTPHLYKIAKDDSNWTRLVDEPVRLITQKALLVFTKEEGAALFSELGFSEQAKFSHAKPSTCACAQESDWCSHQCISTGCTVLTWGCGTFGIYACTGKCYVPPLND